MPGSARVSRATSVRVRLLASRQNDVLEGGFEVKDFARRIHGQDVRWPHRQDACATASSLRSAEKTAGFDNE
jgi:hypothetical protein